MPTRWRHGELAQNAAGPTPREADRFWEATRERGNVWAAGGCGSLIWKQWCLLFLTELMALWVMWGQHAASRWHMAYRLCDTSFWKLCLPWGPQRRRPRMSPRYRTCVVFAVVWAWRALLYGWPTSFVFQRAPTNIAEGPSVHPICKSNSLPWLQISRLKVFWRNSHRPFCQKAGRIKHQRTPQFQGWMGCCCCCTQ